MIFLPFRIIFFVFNAFKLFYFQILSTDGTKIGKITKQWSGFVREALTDADHFGIKFPMDLDVHVKATLLGALILIVIYS